MPKHIRKSTIFGAVALAAFGVIYFLSADVRHFFAQSVSVLAKTDPRDLETGIHQMRAYLLGFGLWAPVISGILMILQMIVAPIPGQLVTFTNGLLFGAFWGTVLSWSSAMAGAALCYGIAAAFGRPVVERLVGAKSIEYVDRFFERYGTKAILVARLIPFVPFDPISYGAGLTNMGFWRFFIATGIGQLPATILYSWLGDKVTGSIKLIFWVFVGVISLTVILSALKPRFERWLIEGRTMEREKVPPFIVIDRVFRAAFIAFLLGFDIGWVMMKNIQFDMSMRTGMFMPVFLVIGLIVGISRLRYYSSNPKPMKRAGRILSWGVAAVSAVIAATIVSDPDTLSLVLPIQMREGFFMGDLKLETARTISYVFFLLGFWRVGTDAVCRLRRTGKLKVKVAKSQA